MYVAVSSTSDNWLMMHFISSYWPKPEVNLSWSLSEYCAAELFQLVPIIYSCFSLPWSVYFSRNPYLIRGQKVGIIGHTTKDKALACLQNCPLLEDLSEWSLWDVVFGPELGNLKDFIQKYGGSHVVTINGNYFGIMRHATENTFSA